jgi:hypothetical protein
MFRTSAASSDLAEGLQRQATSRLEWRALQDSTTLAPSQKGEVRREQQLRGVATTANRQARPAGLKTRSAHVRAHPACCVEGSTPTYNGLWNDHPQLA